MNVKLRYKRPNNLTFPKSSLELIDDTKEQNGDTSKMIQFPLIDTPVELAETSTNFRFAAAVAEFGMLLRSSQYKGNGSFNLVKQLAKNAMGNDEEGYRKEFVQLVENAATLKR